MSKSDMPDTSGERKPAGLYTQEWRAVTRGMSFEERGFVSCVVAAMQHYDLPAPTPQQAAATFNIPFEDAARLLDVFASIPQDVIDGQIERFSELPSALVQEFLP